ncbi:MAG: 3,4-dihydroxy 2-butanone 4-phosphate synthase/GTP cyclohydrolase II [Candidatus Pseudothioglobus sp.]|jgi:3,4-dihydroxy 2-butanone 4-phosphate synthase/GTP cyclohydrolase II
MVAMTAAATLPTQHGDFYLQSYHSVDTSSPVVGEPILVLSKGLDRCRVPLVRIHSECITGDVFGSQRCDCGDQLQRSMALISESGCGAVIYLRQEGRGIGIENKLKAYQLQELGLDTVDANVQLGLPIDARDYADAIDIMLQLGIKQCDLLTNNPQKIAAVSDSSITLNCVVALHVQPSHSSGVAYVKTKQERLGHR